MKPPVPTVDDARDPAAEQVIAEGLRRYDLFFLPEELRRGGVGSRLLQLAEDEGRRRGCVTSFLYTISFQAPGFYERHGYRVLGTIPCNPPGTRRLFLTKALG
jgi:GNAT superfamily N-acetyltransferase